MGLFGRISDLFKKKPNDSERFKSIAIDSEAMQIDRSSIEPKEPRSIISSSNIDSNYQDTSSKLSLEKDSIQLGMAAGYTSRSIRDIESSLIRIESQMVTKDWLSSHLSNYQFNLSRIIEKLEIIYNLLQNEPVKDGDAKEKITSRMRDLIDAVKVSREISYEDLSRNLGMETSALRGLLSNTIRRYPILERFERSNRGWVRYVGNDSSDANRTADPNPKLGLRISFEMVARSSGIKIISSHVDGPLDYVIDDGGNTGVALLDSVDLASVEKSIALLRAARYTRDLSGLWIVSKERMHDDLIRKANGAGIKVYQLGENQLSEAHPII